MVGICVKYTLSKQSTQVVENKNILCWRMRCLNDKTVLGVSAVTYKWKCKLRRSRGFKWCGKLIASAFHSSPTPCISLPCRNPYPLLYGVSQPRWSLIDKPLSVRSLFFHSRTRIYSVIHILVHSCEPWFELHYLLRNFHVRILFKMLINNSIRRQQKHEIDSPAFTVHASASIYWLYSFKINHSRVDNSIPFWHTL